MIRRWRRRSRQVRVELFTRWTLYSLPWIMLVLMAGPVPNRLRLDPPANGLAWTQLALVVVQCALSAPLLRRGLDHRLRERAVPQGLMALAAVLMVAGLGVAVALLTLADQPRDRTAVVTAATLSTLPFSIAWSLLLSIRAFTLVHAGLGAALFGAAAALGVDSFMSVASVAAVLLMAALSLFSVRSSTWVLVVMWELDASREVQARLAVAEERLRFGRDLHDVMGRNLAVIALKSELAVQLARRGRPEAAEQMVEVQRIAQESQREIRDVVRGYREADLQVELAGARSVLRAAEVDCRIEYRIPSEGAQPASAVRSALAWVVREGTTNVLRHAEAARCTVRVQVGRAADGGRTAVLVMENDGAPEAEPRVPGTSGNGMSGNGLKGLRERLAPLGGTLWSGPGEGGTYRLRAELPLEGHEGPETDNRHEGAGV
ncbi:sensor histidine kinase [Streptomyces sp. NPDC059679]|uniref:sensor histidine kinase n=1 Tax=Streptomyces sp. NPDC059679 TaxID=3346903 RepID=UPI0036C4BA22